MLSPSARDVLGLVGFVLALFACGESPPPSVTAPTSSAPTTKPSSEAPPLATAPSSSSSSSSASSSPSPSASSTSLASGGPPADCGPVCKGNTTPALEAALQKAVVRSHRCYDNALATDKTLTGKVTVHISVGTDGSVCEAKATPQPGMEDVAACVVGMLKATPLPGATNQCAAINIPINFVPKKDAKKP
jgi:outer membrane biosynthesis protein TonB